ncbi:hypothetical protein QJQ45_014043 [Haematococcus lacustris]|nr:hypothetical protein QJQ45_014043 [Haematococcus lacustris]
MLRWEEWVLMVCKLQLKLLLQRSQRALYWFEASSPWFVSHSGRSPTYLKNEQCGGLILVDEEAIEPLVIDRFAQLVPGAIYTTSLLCYNEALYSVVGEARHLQHSREDEFGKALTLYAQRAEPDQVRGQAVACTNRNAARRAKSVEDEYGDDPLPELNLLPPLPAANTALGALRAGLFTLLRSNPAITKAQQTSTLKKKTKDTEMSFFCSTTSFFIDASQNYVYADDPDVPAGFMTLIQELVAVPFGND